MSLAAHTRLGPYEILGLIGAGGMGEVYKARDTRLDRTVAIKVLPDHISADPDRRARFEREAKTIAGLSHPHICTLHDVGEHAGSMFLVIEHLDGETLAERLGRGPLPLNQVLTIGTEIAEALSAAHRQSIIHRDLKPANVMLTKGGAKLLDFGLAKLTGHGEQGAQAQLVSAPTRSAPLTGEGVIVGTLQYMAPEQLEGRPADGRTDLWALGAILYEMVTGRRAFDGGTSATVIAAIMSTEPPVPSIIQPLTPPMLDRLVSKCLAKDSDQRWQSAADCADQLRWTRELDGGPPVSGGRSRASRLLLTVILSSLGAASATMVWFRLAVLQPTTQPSSHLIVSLAAAGLALTDGGAAISPDGRTLVFAARHLDDEPQLYARRLDDWEARALKGTEGGVTPFFSPDGAWVAFVANGTLKKTQLGDSTPQTICRTQYQGASRGDWGSDDHIIVSNWPGSLLRVAAEGGTPMPLGAAVPAIRYLWPELLPDGKTLLFTMVEQGHSRIAAMTLASGSVRTVVDSASCGRYLPTGHLVYASEGHVRAVAFDPLRVEPLGPSRVVVDDIAVGEARSIVAFAYDVSASGTIVYMPASTPNSVLVWRDRAGRIEPLNLSPRLYGFPSLSNDGRQITVTVADWPATNVWVGGVEREPLNQVTSSGTGVCSLFSRDGKWVVFTQQTENGWLNLFRTRTDGSGEPERLSEARAYQKPTSFSPAGRMLLFNEAGPGVVDRNIVQTDISRRGSRWPFLVTSANELEAAVSPDGKWVAYQSDESGRWEIYLRAFSSAGPRQRVSVDGGLGPLWNPRGGELFYQTRSALMSVQVVDGVVRGSPVRLFACRKSEDYRREFDVTPDGQHFLFMEPATSRTEINVIPNWFEELKVKVPVKK